MKLYKYTDIKLTILDNKKSDLNKRISDFFKTYLEDNISNITIYIRFGNNFFINETDLKTLLNQFNKEFDKLFSINDFREHDLDLEGLHFSTFGEFVRTLNKSNVNSKQDIKDKNFYSFSNLPNQLIVQFKNIESEEIKSSSNLIMIYITYILQNHINEFNFYKSNDTTKPYALFLDEKSYIKFINIFQELTKLYVIKADKINTANKRRIDLNPVQFKTFSDFINNYPQIFKNKIIVNLPKIKDEFLNQPIEHNEIKKEALPKQNIEKINNINSFIELKSHLKTRYEFISIDIEFWNSKPEFPTQIGYITNDIIRHLVITDYNKEPVKKTRYCDTKYMLLDEAITLIREDIKDSKYILVFDKTSEIIFLNKYNLIGSRFIIDVQRYITDIYGLKDNINLKSASKQLKIELINWHNPTNDAYTTWKILSKILNVSNISLLDKIKQLYNTYVNR